MKALNNKNGKMVKRMTFKKILISTLFLLVALILYSFPHELQQHINIEQEKKYNKIYSADGQVHELSDKKEETQDMER